MKNRIFCFIPARLKSKRFPNKMIKVLNGKRIINFVYDICRNNPLLQKVYVATCDKLISDISKKNNSKIIMTSTKHKDCISRIVEATKKIGKEIRPNDYILIVQGDEVCITNKMISNFCKIIKKRKLDYYNLVSKISLKKDLNSSSIVKCALNKKNEIIFMTRHPIPFEKNLKLNRINTFRQTGIIAFKKDKLLKFSKLKQHYNEAYESIDMLRIIENGYTLQACKTSKRMLGVDTLSDFKEVKKILD